MKLTWGARFIGAQVPINVRICCRFVRAAINGSGLSSILLVAKRMTRCDMSHFQLFVLIKACREKRDVNCNLLVRLGFLVFQGATRRDDASPYRARILTAHRDICSLSHSFILVLEYSTPANFLIF